MQNERLSQKCDKSNMAFSQIWIRPNIVLEMREFLNWLGHLRFGERSKKFGVVFSICSKI